MRMALLMRNPANQNPVTALFVRNSDDTRTLEMGRSALRSAVAAAQSVDIEVKDIERYDVNVVAGVTNEAKQNRASDVMIGLHRKSNVVDSFFRKHDRAAAPVDAPHDLHKPVLRAGDDAQPHHGARAR